MAAASAVANTTKMVMDASEMTTLIGNINTMYSNVLSQFFSIGLGMLAFVGVVLPLAFAYFQNRKMNADNRKLTDEIHSQINAQKSALIDEIKDDLKKGKVEINQELLKMRGEIEIQLALIEAKGNAKTHHHLALTNISSKYHVSALTDCMKAAKGYSFAKDEANLVRVTGLLVNKIIPALNKGTIGSHESVNADINAIIESLEQLNETGRYMDDIFSIKTALKAALAR